MATKPTWEAIKEFYKETFGIDGWLVEMYANLDILILCASGASNESIEKFTELPANEIRKVINDAFEFEGWEKDLDFSPYKMFCDYNGTKSSIEHFVSFTQDVAVELSRSGVFVNQDKVFYLCEAMHDIERKIQDEWI